MQWFGAIHPGLAALLVSALIFVRLAYVLVPLLILRTLRFEKHPTITLFKPAEVSLPNEAVKFFLPAQFHLQSLGYKESAWLLVPHAVPNQTMIVGIFSHESEPDLASLTMIFARENVSNTTLTMMQIEFSASFADESAVMISGCNTLGSFKIPERFVKYVFTEPTDLRLLHHIFQVVVARHTSSRRKIDKLFDKFRGDAADMVRTSMVNEFQREVDRGTMFFNHRSERYCLTIFGAFLFAWKELFPWKQFRYWSNRRRNRKLLKELGIAEKSPRQK